MMRAEEQATKLRALADAMEPQIQAKLNPGVANQNLTQRRARIAAGMEQHGRWLRKIQALLRTMADRLQAGTLPKSLLLVRSRKAVEELLAAAEYKHRYPVDRPDDRRALERIGLIDAALYGQALADLLSLVSQEPQADPVALQIRQLERELIGNQIPGFFQTPEELANRMTEAADLRPGQQVLEPSAGDGRIALAIRRRQPDVELTTIEINLRLIQILALKEFTPIRGNFLEHDGRYDRILMNPPFERFQDIDHVLHAYALLKPGGRLVAITSPGPFFRSENKVLAFREFLGRVEGQIEELPPNTFAGGRQLRQTGVGSRLLIIDKPEEEAQARPHARRTRQTEATT